MDPSDFEQIYQSIGVTLTPVGSRWKSICPFHLDQFPSFYVFEDGGYHCFGCGAHGSLHSILHKMNSEHKFLLPLKNVQEGTIKTVEKMFRQCEVVLSKKKKSLDFSSLCKLYDRLDYARTAAGYEAESQNVSSLKIIRFSKRVCDKITKSTN